MKLLRYPAVLAALGALALPFVLLAAGLTLTSATDVVIFAIACMALNVLVGHTGLVSFGHGAWFGLGAYAAALAQRYWFPGSVLWPALFALAFLVVAGLLIGFLVLRRRGVYFSLLTLAFTALTFSVAESDLKAAEKLVKAAAKTVGATRVSSAGGIAKLSIVGTGMLGAPGIAARMFRALADAGVNIEMISTSEIRITCMVSRDQVEKGVRILHKAFELDQELA